jgi:hypothetical protein
MDAAFSHCTDQMTYIKKRYAVLTLLCVLSAPVPTTAEASADMFGAMFRMMLVMMNVMSDAMLGNTSNSGMGNPLGSGMTSWPMMSGMTGMNPISGYGGMSPWSGSGGFPMSGMGMSPWSGSGGFPMSGMGMSPWSGMNSFPMNGSGTNPWSNSFGNNPAYPPPNAYPYYANTPYSNRGYGGYNGGYPSQQLSLLDGRWYGNAGEMLEIRDGRFRLLDGQAGIDGAIRVENNIVNLYSPQTGTVTQYTFIRNQSELVLQDATGQVLNFHLQPINNITHTF